MTPAEVIALFQTPETLMRRCYLQIAGSGGAVPPNGQAAIATFTVAVDDTQAVTRLYHQHQRSSRTDQKPRLCKNQSCRRRGRPPDDQ